MFVRCSCGVNISLPTKVSEKFRSQALSQATSTKIFPSTRVVHFFPYHFVFFSFYYFGWRQQQLAAAATLAAAAATTIEAVEKI
jgi:hypothetical protein